MTIDFESDAVRPQGDLAEVSEMAQKLQNLAIEIKQMEQELKSKKSEFERIESADLPDLMDALQLKGVDLTNGDKVVVKSIIKASLPTQTAIDRAKDTDRIDLQTRLRDGLFWLRDNGAGAMIKNLVSTDLGKGNDKVADKVSAAIRTLGLQPKRIQTVHPQTLSAYVRERLEQGADVPFNTFAVYSGRKAAIIKSR